MSLLFMILVAAGLPLLSALSYRNIRQLEAEDAQVQLAKAPIYLQSMALQLGLALIAFFTARNGRLQLPFTSQFSAGTIGAAVLFVTLALGLAWYSQKTNKEDTESTLHHLLPDTWRDRILWFLAVAVAAFCEEYVYRGVLFQLLLEQTGNAWWLAALLSAIVFGFGHGTQGEKAILQIIPFALGFHALVFLSKGLLLPMIVHFIYNIAVELLFGRKIKEQAGEKNQ
jgi:membrane protease YdiL (CAAX protease family)